MPEQSKPVAVLIRPRLDEDRNPSCDRCPFAVFRAYKADCSLEASHFVEGYRRPSSRCPVHYADARQKNTY